MPFVPKEQYTIEDLLTIIKILRSPDGCPWDRAQTHESIRRNFIEETYEVIEAIDTKDPVGLREELGDVLLQIVLHSAMEEEKDSFNFQDVCDTLCKKLVFRHPHVFGDETADSDQQALQLWEESKRKEKNQTTATHTLKQVATALPALMYAEKVQKRAANVGFDYAETVQVLEHLESEIAELKQAIAENHPASIHEELGDVLFSAVNVARFVDVDPEKALDDSTEKFISRFANVERLATQRGIGLEEASDTVLLELWHEAKKI